ncbi:O-methyltransferase [Collybia nuda]|uniref:O-methyltransferase n=1 Tax=Collybia nuda TaxID=64659 RepID=A0A9P6CBW3_9AGAR|nr:O-methyltransferase [Collybia nuda]
MAQAQNYIISASVDQIDAAFENFGQQYPSLDKPFNPTAPSEAISLSPEVVRCSSLIVAACGHLSANVNVPAMSIYATAGGFHVSAALGAALEGNTVEILRDHPSGLSIYDISAQNGMDPIHLGRILRLLATHHIFIEITPNVFKNNRLSSMMDTLKTVNEIQSDPENKHVGTPGMSALIEHTCDEIMKGASFLTEFLTDPVMGSSGAQEHSPMGVAFKYNKPSWEWYENPGNEYRVKRFMAAMEGSTKFDPPNAILQGFDWGSLPSKALVVDVGGGMGHTTKKICEAYPDLKYVVQDRPMVIEQGRSKFWRNEFSEALSDGSVVLQAHDFLTEQLILHANVFLCRMILHDYGRSMAKVILQHLRDAASQDTKLLIVDTIVPYACLDESQMEAGRGIPGMEFPQPPAPLLANLGKANAIPYIADFQMLVGFNGEERTIGTFTELLYESGWKITRVFTIPGSIHKQILAVVA